MQLAFRTPASIVASKDGQRPDKLPPQHRIDVKVLHLGKPTRPGVLLVSKMRNRVANLSASYMKGRQHRAPNATSETTPTELTDTTAASSAAAPLPAQTDDPRRICKGCRSMDCMEVASAHEIVCKKCGMSVDASLMADVHFQYGLRSTSDQAQNNWTRIPTSCSGVAKHLLVSTIQQGACGNNHSSSATGGDATRCPSSTGYKRVSHFMERLAQLQGQERVAYPEGLIEALRSQLARLRIQPEQITPQTVRFLLKKLRKPQYFENCNALANLLGKFQLPKLADELRDKLRTMFLVIQSPFEECSPPGRKNFLSYNFVLRKFLEIIEQDHLLAFFPPLKSRDKNVEQELVWQRMCSKLGWPYYPTT